MKTTRSALLALALLVLTLLPAAATAQQTGTGMPDIVARFEADRSTLRRFWGIPMSAVVRERLGRFDEEWLTTLAGIDFEALDHAGRIDYVLLENEIRSDLAEIGHEAERDGEVAELLPFREVIVTFEQARRQRKHAEPGEAADRVAAITRAVKAVRKDLEERIASKAEEARKPTKTLAWRAAERTVALRRLLDGWYAYRGGYDPLFTWWVEAPYEEAKKALDDYAKFLRRKLAGVAEGEDDPIIGDPIGRQALLDLLRHEMIPYTPEELVAIAEREFAWCESEMRRAARDMGLGEDQAAALERVKADHVPPGRQDALIEELALEAITFLDERDLVTIPDLCRETWRIEMLSPKSQKSSPFFNYGGQAINVAYPTDGMSHDDKLMAMRGNNVHFSRATVQHELIPGHHLQGFQSQRHNVHRRVFGTAFLVEGWALYWELRLWDLGFPKTPENRVGMLFWRMHRCARIIVSLGFHLGTMQPQEMIDFLVERVGHERSTATAEVRRFLGGSYGPLYQCAYMLGGLQMLALHGELVGAGRMTEREFHDAVLREGAIPIEMIRASLTGQELERDHVPSWRGL